MAVGRHHAGMVRGDSLLQRHEPAVVPEHVEIVVGQCFDVVLRDRTDARTFVGVGEAKAGGDARVDGVVAGGAAEDEEDRR